MSDLIIANQADGVLTLTLNRASKKNAFTRDMYSTMADHIKAAADNPEVTVILINSQGDFSAGNDLVDFLENPPSEMNSPVFRFMKELYNCPLPVVAAVDGVAVGIGTTMLPHCDFVYATDRAVFMLPFINLNLLPEYGSTQLLPQMAGHAKAAELLMLGEKFDAQVAMEIKLINSVCCADELQQTAQNTARKLASKNRDVLIATKALLRRDAEPMLNRIEVEAEAFMKVLHTPEAQAAFNAILKR